MRFKEFLLREEDMTLTLEQGLSYIKDHCQAFLRDIRGTDNWMYRGMKLATNKVIVMDHISERAPRDSAPDFNVFFNTGIDLSFDIPMVRANALFCLGDKQGTSQYGNTYFVFPQGHYKYIWSPSISDSYIQEDRMYNAFAKKLSDLTDEDVASTHQMKGIFQTILRKSGANIRRAVTNMKTNDELVEESFSEHDVNASIEQIDRALKLTFDPLYFPNQDMKEALDSGNEILLYESDGCYFVPRALVQSVITGDDTLDGQSPEEYLTNYFFPGA